MSHSEDFTDSGPTTAFYQGVDAGIKQERERSIKLLEDKLKNISVADVHEREGIFSALTLIREDQRHETLDAPIVKRRHPPVEFRDKGNGE